MAKSGNLTDETKMAKTEELTVLGVDPSTTAAGLALVRGDEVLWAETVKLTGELMQRYVDLAWHVGNLCLMGQAQAVAIESTYVGANRQTAVKLATAVGAAIHAAAQKVGFRNVHLLSPSETKAAVAGDGRASKEAVMKAVKLTTTGRVPATEHESDAVATARTLADRLKLKIAAEEFGGLAGE